MVSNSNAASLLTRARQDLVAAREAAKEIGAREDQSITDGSTYRAWTAELEAANLEVTRLENLIAVLEPKAEQEARDAAVAELRDRRSKLSKSHKLIVARTRTDVERINELAISLIRDLAQADIETRKFNAAIVDVEDLDPVVSPDVLARGAAPLHREEISRRRVMLWVNQDTGHLAGNQNSVKDNGNGRGLFVSMSGASMHFVKQPFDEVKTRAPVPAQRLIPAWSIRLLQPDGPRVIFDGTSMSATEVLAALDRIANDEPQPRQIETELYPATSAELSETLTEE